MKTLLRGDAHKEFQKNNANEIQFYVVTAGKTKTTISTNDLESAKTKYDKKIKSIVKVEKTKADLDLYFI